MSRPTCVTDSCLRVSEISVTWVSFLSTLQSLNVSQVTVSFVSLHVSRLIDGKLDTCNNMLENKMLDHGNPIETNATLSILM